MSFYLADDIDVPEDAETNDVAMEPEEHADTSTRMALPAKLLKLNPLKSALKKTDKSKSTSKSSKEGKSKDGPDGGVRSPRNSVSHPSGFVAASDVPDSGSLDSSRLAKRDTEEGESEPEENIPLVTLTRPAEDT
jgi:hypothetical protein